MIFGREDARMMMPANRGTSPGIAITTIRLAVLGDRSSSWNTLSLCPELGTIARRLIVHLFVVIEQLDPKNQLDR